MDISVLLIVEFMSQLKLDYRRERKSTEWPFLPTMRHLSSANPQSRLVRFEPRILKIFLYISIPFSFTLRSDFICSKIFRFLD